MGLDEKALEAARKWKFKPAMLNGKPVPVRVNIEIRFMLLP
jgi:TonB family protein